MAVLKVWDGTQYVEVGGVNLSGFTDGSVLFADGGTVQEDNANFFWDDTNDSLLLGHNTSGFNVGINVYPRLHANSTSAATPEALFEHEETGGAATAVFAKARTGGAQVQDGDALGTFIAYGHDGTDYAAACDILFEVDGTVAANDVPGKIRFRTWDGASTADRVVINADGSVEIVDTTTFGTTSTGGEIGWRTTPESLSAIAAEFADSTIVNFIRVEFSYTGSGLPTSGYNVMNYLLYDQSTAVGSNGTHAVQLSGFYDRASPPASTHNIRALYVPGYGQRSSRTITSGTFAWTGIEVSAAVVAPSRVTGGTFVFTDLLLGAAPTDYSGATSFTHYSIQAQSTVFIDVENGGSLGVGESAPATAIETAEDITISATLTDGYAAALTIDPAYTKSGGPPAIAVTRHNYIDLNNPTTTGSIISVTDSCVFRFDDSFTNHTALEEKNDEFATVGDPSGFVKVNVNGTVYKFAVYPEDAS